MTLEHAESIGILLSNCQLLSRFDLIQWILEFLYKNLPLSPDFSFDADKNSSPKLASISLFDSNFDPNRICAYPFVPPTRSLTPKTTIHWFATGYRFVFILDVSPSMHSVDLNCTVNQLELEA